MKHGTTCIATLLLMMAGWQSAWAQKVTLYKTNGETIRCDVSELDSIVFEVKMPPAEEIHEWVDLGLPSGTLWATCNIGSRCPEEYGHFFSWGETEPKDIHDTGHYKWNRGSGMMTKYCTIGSFGSGGMTDGLTELLAEDDAATANWGKDWQMPSREQVEELTDTTFTTSKWTNLNDFLGTKITSKRNGNWIFLPASPRDAYDCAHTWSGVTCGADRRYLGENVRPVRVEKMARVLVSRIILSSSAISLLPEETESITATVLPTDAFTPDVRWESSDEMIAAVDSRGLVTAFFPGTCTITCRAVDGSGIYAECQVTVEEP